MRKEFPEAGEFSQGESEEHLNGADEAAEDVVVAEGQGAHHRVGRHDDEEDAADGQDIPGRVFERRGEFGNAFV